MAAPRGGSSAFPWGPRRGGHSALPGDPQRLPMRRGLFPLPPFLPPSFLSFFPKKSMGYTLRGSIEGRTWRHVGARECRPRPAWVAFCPRASPLGGERSRGPARGLQRGLAAPKRWPEVGPTVCNMDSLYFREPSGFAVVPGQWGLRGGQHAFRQEPRGSRPARAESGPPTTPV